jgi:hypothetical protein
MQAVSTQSPLIKRARQEAVFLSSSLIDRCVDAALVALEGVEQAGLLGRAWDAIRLWIK